MDKMIKLVPDMEMIKEGMVPFIAILLVIIAIIIATIILVRNEIKGVKKNEKN